LVPHQVLKVSKEGKENNPVLDPKNGVLRNPGKRRSLEI